MNPLQHQQLASFLERLTLLQQRMARVQHVFPNHYAELKHRYNQMLLEAREAQVMPPWMIG